VKEEEVDTMTEEIMTDVATMLHKELIIEFMLKTLPPVLAGKI